MIDFETAVKFPTKDREWKRKVLIGGLLNIVPVINFFPMGYAYHLFRSEIRRRRVSLPEWENWGQLFLQGFIVFFIGLIYSLAALILFLVHPIMGVLAFVTVALLLPAALAQYAVSGNFARAFSLRDIWGIIRQTRGDYLIGWIIMLGISILLIALGTIPVLGWIISAIAGFYAYLVIAVLFGQICSRSNFLYKDFKQPPDEETWIPGRS
jgi:hypothetical protein